MRIACSTLCFSQQPLAEACRQIAALGFQYVDLGIQDWAQVKSADLVADYAGVRDRVQSILRRHGLKAIAMNVGLGRADPMAPEAARLDRICALASDLDIPAICLNAPRRGSDLAQEVSRLARLVGIAAYHGVRICLETHRGCLTEDPHVACWLAQQVPGLGLALDASHFCAGPCQGGDFACVYPHVGVTHLRDAGRSWEEIQLPPGKGAVDFRTMLTQLHEAGYTGALSVEYIDTIRTPGADGDHAAQVRAMAELATSLLQELGLTGSGYSRR